MAMQLEAWMILFLFNKGISHLICALEKRGGISNENRHLLIVDGHNFHVIMEVVVQAMKVGLDVFIIPSHTSHRL